MMVGNDIRHDTRVYKSALALADGGVQVTLLGWSPSGYREDSVFGPVRIIRVPVPFALRASRNARVGARRSRRLLKPALTAQEWQTRVQQHRLRLAEAQEFGDLALAARAQADRARIVFDAQWNRVRRRVAPREEALRQALSQWRDDQTAFASWRRELPEIDDYELAYAPVIDAEPWDVLHAHDVHHVGTAARAVARRRAQGLPARWVYDAHEYVAGVAVAPGRGRRVRAAYTQLEAEYIHRADAVITVTPPLADHLAHTYALPETPTVVMNAPQLQASVTLERPDVRATCGLGPQVPLLVYSGGVTHARGVHTVVEALPSLPGVHLAVVCVPHTRTLRVLNVRRRAEELGVADRVHLLEPVAPAQVAAFLATADVGVHPLLHFDSHEFALPNKLFEYLHAGLPLVVSDCRALAQFVRQNEVGSVFTAEDPQACAIALREVLDRRDALHRRIAADDDLLTPYGWERQAVSLRGLYRRLLDDAVTEPETELALHALSETPAWRDDRPSVVGFGPVNRAGQAWAWAKALERDVPGLTSRVIEIDRGPSATFPADEVVDMPTFRRNPGWGARLEDEAIASWTHVLLEAGRSLFGIRHGKDLEGDVKLLLSRGLRVGLIMHGPEIRDPSRHVGLTSWSRFADPADRATAQLQAQRDVLAVKVREFADQGLGPVFVSTPDLLPDVPGSTWLPIAVDTGVWLPAAPVMGHERPVVLHVSRSDTPVSGSALDRALSRLHERGVIDYRARHDVPVDRIHDELAAADIVLGGFDLGTYGSLECEAMALERVVLGHVVPQVRDAAREAAGQELPLLEATADTVEEIIAYLLTRPEAARELATAGRRFVETLHDGRASARVLREHLHLRGTGAAGAPPRSTDPVDAAATAALAQAAAVGALSQTAGRAEPDRSARGA